MDIFIHILQELNVTTHNIIYLCIGCIISTVIIKAHRRISPMIFLYDACQRSFIFLKEFNDERLYKVFNETVIRCVCILAHDGIFASKDMDFIRRGLDKIDGIDQNTKEVIINDLTKLVETVIEFEKHYTTDGISLISNLLNRRRRNR